MYIKKLILSFFERLVLRQRIASTPEAELQELYILILMAARRCAYDMNHCANEFDTYKKAEDSYEVARSRFWHETSLRWQKVFEVDSGKRYRHELHHEIYNLMHIIEKYEKLLKTLDIYDPIAADKIPF